MSVLRCSCGQHNPKGTTLCGGCGKPLEEESKKEPIVNMRYEGAARRSQTNNKTWVDKIWNFFSSVKVGVWIIVLLLVASSLGTVFPQEMYIPPTVHPSEYYQDEYGYLGKLYYELGFHNLYDSWWYLLLMAALTISLLIASVDRFFPLYRSLKNQRVKKHMNFMKKQRLVSETASKGSFDNKEMKKFLEEKKYKVKTDGNSLLAEKGRFSRWGPYVNHIGLILFLIGGMLRFFPGMFVDHQLWIREGEVEVIPGTNGEYYLENHQFLVEFYDEDDEIFQEAIQRNEEAIVKTYESTVTLYKREENGVVGSTPELQEIESFPIRVNDPLKFDGFALYQVNYKLNELNSMGFTLENEESGETIGEFTVDLFDPDHTYELPNDYTIQLKEYFPDFFMEDDTLSTRSPIPDNPAFVFEVDSPNQNKKEVSFLTIGQNFDPTGENVYTIKLADLDTKHVTGLTVRKDYTLPLLFVGGFIFMVGLVQGSYWTHRRIWIKQDEDKIILAAHTNKNWLGIRREIDEVTERFDLEQVIDRNEETSKGEDRPND